jgi:hypothetical protein
VIKEKSLALNIYLNINERTEIKKLGTWLTEEE